MCWSANLMVKARNPLPAREARSELKALWALTHKNRSAILFYRAVALRLSVENVAACVSSRTVTSSPALSMRFGDHDSDIQTA
jgi:hypothetical protein